MHGVRIFIAFIAIVLLWSLTPLAIKWSGEGTGFLIGVEARMLIGYLGVLLVLAITRTHLPLDGRALLSYLAGSLHLFGGLTLTYWSSQHLPSGWISVIFGLTPLLTAPLAAIILGDKSFTWPRIISYGLGVGGLVVLFHTAFKLSVMALLAVAGILLSAFLQALSSVWVKAIRRDLNPFAQVAGSLTLSIPCYGLTSIFLDPVWPHHYSSRSLLSILFLGIVATSFGFSIYYYVLKKLSAGRVSLISLLTPVLSLYVGNVLNQEPLHREVLFGTFLILLALMFYEWETLKPSRRIGWGWRWLLERF